MGEARRPRPHHSATWYGYDGVQRLTSLSHGAYTPASTEVAYSYIRNAADQLASAGRDNDAYGWMGHYAVQRAHTANTLNQYSAAGSASFTYDANGNLITSPGPG